jgi:hypothetical protein
MVFFLLSMIGGRGDLYLFRFKLADMELLDRTRRGGRARRQEMALGSRIGTAAALLRLPVLYEVRMTFHLAFCYPISVNPSSLCQGRAHLHPQKGGLPAVSIVCG